MPKRRRQDLVESNVDDETESTPRKTRRSAQKALPDHEAGLPDPNVTPSNRKSILRATPLNVNGAIEPVPTPTLLKKVLFSTPAKENEQSREAEETPLAVRNDRSARRKSARTLQKQHVPGDASDYEDEAQDERVAKLVLDEDNMEEDDDPVEDDEVEKEHPVVTDTPSKPGRPRGRPKGRRRERTPSPPADLPPHEQYFFQNRAGGNKTSANTLPSQLLLNHEDYRTHITNHKETHEADIKQLKQLHERAFDQWMFELDEGFNICLYGYGSKRGLIMSFAQHIHHQTGKAEKTVVVNGYTSGLTVKDLLTTITGQILPKSAKLPAQASALLDLILATLSEAPSATRLRLIIHSLDHSNLRKSATQSLLARLAAHPKIALIASCDTPNFGLLWDLTLTRQFKFLYHDATTFEPYRVEIDVVEEVNALLGRSGRRLGGKDGVGYVLKSLPENARNLFRILVAEQLAAADSMPDATLGAHGDEMDVDDILGASDKDDAAMQQDTPSKRGRGRPAKKAKAKAPPLPKPAVAGGEGVEYRTLYHKVVEEFVCSSELNFRTLLKEFHDHRMIESRKDGLGTERLIVPFRREELETILEELV